MNPAAPRYKGCGPACVNTEAVITLPVTGR
jgi:hypothetical protein